MKDQIRHPSGFPYVLFVSETDEPTFFLSVNEDSARRRVPGQEVVPVRINDLTLTYGHATTSNFLKKFGESWTCVSGNIFYKKDLIAENEVRE